MVVVTSKYDGVEAGFAPQLHEVNHIPEAQRGVTGEHHARLTELAAEVSVNTGVVLQLVGLDQLKRRHKKCKREVYVIVSCTVPPSRLKTSLKTLEAGLEAEAVHEYTYTCVYIHNVLHWILTCNAGH